MSVSIGPDTSDGCTTIIMHTLCYIVYRTVVQECILSFILYCVWIIMIIKIIRRRPILTISPRVSIRGRRTGLPEKRWPSSPAQSRSAARAMRGDGGVTIALFEIKTAAAISSTRNYYYNMVSQSDDPRGVAFIFARLLHDPSSGWYQSVFSSYRRRVYNIIIYLEHVPTAGNVIIYKRCLNDIYIFIYIYMYIIIWYRFLLQMGPPINLDFANKR